MPSRHGRSPRVPADVHVAARLDHEVAKPAPAKDVDRAIDGVALADAAEVHAHALPLQERRARAIVDLDVAIVDERQTLRDLAAVGDAIVLVLVVELPQAGQRGERDVEPCRRSTR